MKKNWAIIFGTLLLVGGFGNIGSDMKAAIFGIVVGIVLIALWILAQKIASRKKISGKTLKSNVQSDAPTSHFSPSAAQTEQSPSGTGERPKPPSYSSPPTDQPPPSNFKLSIEISGFGEDDAEPENLDFYRDKLNSKKALITFDTYVVLDCETTGFSPKSDEIIEIALAKYIKGELVDTFSSLVAPSRPISARITELTGITNADLKNAPTPQVVIPQVWNFMDGFTLVGHNIPFDIKFLKAEFSKNGYEGRFNYVDTLQLARTAFPDFPNHKLSTCIDKLSLSDGQTHRAMDDVECTQRLLEKCLPILLEQKERELAERRAKRATATKG